MSVVGTQATGTFIPAGDVYRHPTLPLWIIGLWHGRATITGDGTGGTASVNLIPCTLPDAYPQDFWFTIQSLEINGEAASGDQHKLTGFSDIVIGGAVLDFHAQIEGADDAAAADNYPSAATVPVWLSWLLRRNVRDGSPAGSLTMLFETNVNSGAYDFLGNGLVLMQSQLLPDFLERLRRW